MGTSVGSTKGLKRMIELSWLDLGCLKFLSLEPLHQRVDLSTTKREIIGDEYHVLPAFDWIIVGGESGNETGKSRYRPCELEWIESIVKDCRRNQIPVFVKQMGTYLSKQMKLKDRHGGDISEFPEHLQVREFPLIMNTQWLK